MSKALGLVETRGLVAAIEAADAMVKAANVILIGKERTDPALITIKIVGETAAVRSSVDAGAAAASRVGVLVSTHIIPQPDLQITSLFPEIRDDENLTSEKISSKVVKTSKVEEPTFKADKISTKVKKPSAKAEEPQIIPEIKSKAEKQIVVKEKRKDIPEVKIEKPDERKNLFSESDTISRLRKEALGIKEEKPAVKKSTGKINMREIEILNVHQLRRLARSTDGFPIQGREISRANRNELLDHFKKIS